MAKKKKKHAPGSWPDLLKRLREAREMTQAEAAQRLGVALRTWISWENAHRTPSGPSVQLLRNTFPELRKV